VAGSRVNVDYEELRSFLLFFCVHEKRFVRNEIRRFYFR